MVFVTCVPSGKVSNTTTLVALDGPAFVTVIVFVYVAPASTVAGPTFCSITSDTGVTAVTARMFVLFTELESYVSAMLAA